MPRFAGVDIPRNKQIGTSLTYIYGIGPTTAKKIIPNYGVTSMIGCLALMVIKSIT